MTDIMQKKYDLTEGPILKSLVALAVPIIFTNILQTAYNLTDTFWVGRLGSYAIASVSVSFPVIFLMVSLGAGMGMAGTILVAQYKGKKNSRAVDHITAQTFLMITLISLLLSISGYLLSPIFIKLMHTDQQVYTNAVQYMKISFIGIIFMFTYMVFQSLMRGVGNVKTPMFIVMGTVVLNFFLDPLFIFGYSFIPASGVSGAALATISTQGLAGILGIFLLLRGKQQIHLKIKDMRPDIPLIKKMIAIGLPASIEHSTRALGMTVMTFLIATFGTMTLAAYGIGFRVLTFVVIPAMGLSMATATLVGQNIGAGKINRAEKIVKLSSITGFSVLSAVGIAVFIFSGSICALFIPGEKDTILSAAKFIKIMALSFGTIGIQMSVFGAFRGSGNTMLSMMLSIISLWVLRFPLAYILSKHTYLAETGLWLAFPAANIISAIVAVAVYLKGSWKDKKLTEEIELENETAEEIILDEGIR